MSGIIPYVRFSVKERILKRMSKCRNARMKIRYLIIVNLFHGRTVKRIVEILNVSRSTVYRVAKRFREHGEAGLVDRREENGRRKLDERYLAKLYYVVKSSPLDHDWRRPTWTREMLVETLQKLTGIRVHCATMSVACKCIKARRGKPKPTVRCPWSKRARNRKLRKIKQLLASLPPDEVAFYEDEVDIHLNPKIGLDWMVSGQQKEVVTPGQNVKRYMAGAQDSRTGEMIWVEGESKNTLLFIRLLWELVQRHPEAKVIHVILDNYSIHHTQQVTLSLATEHGRRIDLHFLPPYCPDHNKIERTWQDLHSNVTRNHRCSDMAHLMREVRVYLRRRNMSLSKKGESMAA